MKRSDQAYIAIRDKILGGEFPPGTRMREENLSSVIGLSRTPIREALHRLEVDGIVEYQQSYGLIVSAFTTRDVEDLFDLRVMIEGYCAHRAALRCTEADIEELHELASKMADTLATESSTVALQKITMLNNQFHQTIARCSGNGRAVKLLNGLVEVGIVLRTYSGYGAKQLDRSMRGHLELVDTFRARDPEWARSVMTAHLLTAKHTFMGLVDPPKEEPTRRRRARRIAVPTEESQT